MFHTRNKALALLPLAVFLGGTDEPSVSYKLKIQQYTLIWSIEENKLPIRKTYEDPVFLKEPSQKEQQDLLQSSRSHEVQINGSCRINANGQFYLCVVEDFIPKSYVSRRQLTEHLIKYRVDTRAYKKDKNRPSMAVIELSISDEARRDPLAPCVLNILCPRPIYGPSSPH